MTTVTPIRSKHETDLLAEAAERLREEANPREVAKHAEELTPGQLRCRRMRQHMWEPSMAEKVRGGFTETLYCPRCKSSKPGRRYNSRGHLVDSGNIDYSEGYLFKGLGRLGEAGRDVVNLASLRADVQMSFELAGAAKNRAAAKAAVPKPKPTVSANGHKKPTAKKAARRKVSA